MSDECPNHNPYTVYFDNGPSRRAVVRCDGGCGLFTEYSDPEDAEEVADNDG